MAATTAGALKALIEGLGLGISAYRNHAPEGQAMPYIVIQEGISRVPNPIEDFTLTTGVESVQVDVWQTMGAENHALVPGLLAGLHGKKTAAIGTPARTVYSILVRNCQGPLEDEQLAQVRHIVDLDVEREL